MRLGTGSPVISTIMIVVNNVTLEHGDGKTASYQTDDAINPTFCTWHIMAHLLPYSFPNELAGTAWILWLLSLGYFDLKHASFENRHLRHKPDHFLPGMQQLQWEHQSYWPKQVAWRHDSHNWQHHLRPGPRIQQTCAENHRRVAG